MTDVAEAVQTGRTDGPPEQDNVQPVKGRVDAIDEGRLYGWAFDPAAPDERLRIRILQDGKVIAEAVADRSRADLRRNGIGDGMHAFEIALPPAAGEAGGLTAIAFNGQGAAHELRVPRPDEQAAEALIAAPLSIVLDKLDLLMAAQRQLHVSQRSFLRTQQIDPSGEAAPVGLAEIGDAIGELGAEINQRLNDLDVHLMRLDGVVAGMEGKMDELQKRSNGELKPLFLLLSVLVGLAAGALLTLAAG